MLDESSRLRESTARIDASAHPVPDPVGHPQAVPQRGSPDRTEESTNTFERMRRAEKDAMPRTPSVILLLLGMGFMSGPWIEGFESIGRHGLTLEWAGQLMLSIGGMLWLRDYVRQGQDVSGKLDATIAGLHVLRRDIATPPQSSDAHRQLADLKRRLSAVARSIKF